MKGFHKEIVSFLTILENYFDAMTWLQGNYLSNLRKYLVKYETQNASKKPLYHSLYLKWSDSCTPYKNYSLQELLILVYSFGCVPDEKYRGWMTWILNTESKYTDRINPFPVLLAPLRETYVYTIIHENAYRYVLGWTAQNNWCCNIPSSKKRFFLTVPHSFPKPSFMNQDTAGKSHCKLFIYDTVRKMSEWWC